MLVNRIEDLVIYKIALDLAIEIADLVKRIPYNWSIVEAGQILRCSSSVHSNIAEGFSHRFYLKQFIRYLNIALGSSDEAQNHLQKLRNSNHLNIEVTDNYIKRYKNLSVRILNLINYLRKKT
ncbi:four helix bundle protein [Patescibacteria group bacterium]|nr:four helix bundle protein [Patescibacteria group bacterium]